MHFQELYTADYLDRRAVDVEWSWDGRVPLEVNSHLLCLLNIQRKVVVLTPFQLSDLVSVCRLVIVTDECHHCCVISKLCNVIEVCGMTVLNAELKSMKSILT